MNNQMEKKEEKLFFRGKNKAKDLLLLCISAFVIFFMAWWVFGGEKQATSSSMIYSEKEEKIVRMLEKMQGVGAAEVVVCETEEGVESVVVLCEGAKDFQVVIAVREAVATALGTDQKNVKIYLKKE